MAKRKGKFGPQKKKRNMEKVQCYIYREYEHNKRGMEEAHLIEEMEEAKKKKSKEEVKYLYYD